MYYKCAGQKERILLEVDIQHIVEFTSLSVQNGRNLEQFGLYRRLSWLPICRS